MKLEKLVLLFALPATWWNSGWVELIGCAVWEGGILFPLLPLLCLLWGKEREEEMLWSSERIISKSRC